MVNIDVDKDSPEVISSKIALMSEHNKVQREQVSFEDKRKIFKVMFWILFIVLAAGGFWAVYVFSHASTSGLPEQELAKFVFGTVGSAAVAAIIGLLASPPK